MTRYILGIIVFLIVVIIGRLFSERALKHISGEQKQALIDGFSLFRRISLLPILLFAIAYFVLLFYLPIRMITLPFLAIVFAYVVILNILLLVRLRTLAIPGRYTRTAIFVRILNLAGIAGMFWLVLFLP